MSLKRLETYFACIFQELFYCHGIRKLSISDNEIKTIPAAIESLISLEHIDLSKNGKAPTYLLRFMHLTVLVVYYTTKMLKRL